jgi:dolichol-phosphate mannosyltransferase
VKSLFKNIFSLKNRIGKFSIVGISGIVVNQGMLTILIELVDMDVEWAGFIAIGLSILSNFLLNNFWTWRDKRDQHIAARFGKYLITTFISGGINWIVLVGLSYMGLYPLIANLIGIGMVTIINFILNHYWTFK